jgi:hypothetical protein
LLRALQEVARLRKQREAEQEERLQVRKSLTSSTETSSLKHDVSSRFPSFVFSSHFFRHSWNGRM